MITLFSPKSLGPISKPFSIKEQITISAVGMADGDMITFERLEFNPADTPAICGCEIIPAGPLSIIGATRLLCPDCPPLEGDGERIPVRLTTTNPVVILDWPQNSVLRAIYHGTALEAGGVTVIAEETNTGDLTDAMRGCPPLCCGIDYPEVWNETGMKRCDDATQTVEVQQASNCGRVRWTTDPTPPSNYWSETGQKRCFDATQTVEVQQANPCGEVRWVADPTPPTNYWSETGQKRCNNANQTVEIQEANPCGEVRWMADPTPPLNYWAETGIKRCDDASQTVEVQEVNPCGELRWVPDPTPPVLYWAETGQKRCNNANQTVEIQEANPCGTTRWVDDPTPPLAYWVATGAQSCINGLSHDQEINPCGETRWTATAFACSDARWFPWATLPIPCDGMAYRPDPALRDPAATVELTECVTGVPLGYLYPTPREGASTPVYDCACDENILGYAVDGYKGAAGACGSGCGSSGDNLTAGTGGCGNCHP